MKLKIVQAVKLGTVACLLAVTTQTIGEGSKADYAEDQSTEIVATAHCHASDGRMYADAKADRNYNQGDNIRLKVEFLDNTCAKQPPNIVVHGRGSVDRAGEPGWMP